VPSGAFGPVYRVTGDWEMLVESRQTLEWIKALCVGVLAAFLIGPVAGSTDFVSALYVFAFMVLMQLMLAALDAFWVAHHAADLELVDRAASGLDQWRADRARQRSWGMVLFGALVFSGTGGWMLWSMTRPEPWMNPWFVVPMALLLIGTAIKGVLRKLRTA
jgi:hypothetical protein